MPPAAAEDCAARIAALGFELGIPAEYATTRRLPLQAEAAKLVDCGCDLDGRVLRLTPGAAAEWLRMVAAARTDGVVLQAVSGFRSVARQAEIIREKLATGPGLAEILASVAAPGFSEHHTGRAVDITTPSCELLSNAFGATPAFRWLAARAGQFGFALSYPADNPHGLVTEPWHWCWQRGDSAGVPPSVARE